MPKVSPAPTTIQLLTDTPAKQRMKAVNPFAALMSGLNLGVAGGDAAVAAPTSAERTAEPSENQHAQPQAQDPQVDAQEEAEGEPPEDENCAVPTAAGDVVAAIESGQTSESLELPGGLDRESSNGIHEPLGASKSAFAMDILDRSPSPLISGSPAAERDRVSQENQVIPQETPAPASVTQASTGDGRNARLDGASTAGSVPETASSAQPQRMVEAELTRAPGQADPVPASRDHSRTTHPPHSQSEVHPSAIATPQPPPIAAAQNSVASQIQPFAPSPARAQATARGGPLQGVGPLGALPATAAKQAALNRLTAQAPALRQSVVQHAFIPQAAKGLALALKQGDGTITINLKPGHLGSLRVEVSMQGSEVTAKLEASSETARQLLTDAQPSLRAALEARGLSVERIEVTAAPPSAPSQDAADQRPDHRASGDAGGKAGHHTGSGAEAHTGGERGGRRGDFEVEDTWQPAPVEVSFTLEQGGVYRLHLDAVA